MYYTYILKSLSQRGAIYIRYTDNLRVRLTQHNSIKNNGVTKCYQPWDIETYVGFTNAQEAKEFEKYLKSNSGKAFMHKRLLSKEFVLALKKFNNGRGNKISVA